MRGVEAGARLGRRHCASLLFATLIVVLAFAPSARAAFHEILVREVYAGGASNDSYVVLQAYTGGQNLLSGHSITAYNATGGTLGTFTFGGTVSNSQNQMTVLVADSSYAVTFPSGPSPDGTEATFNLSPTGGAVCWTGLDCVSWGNFSGTVSPSPGPPAASPGGIAAGMALRRTISEGNCSNRLDLGDDTNDSAADFTQQAPHPRSNASPIEEGATCTPPQLPTATIDSGPDNPTKATSASFTYDSTPPGASFECKLDSAAFSPCEADGIDYPGPLADGNHTFQVRAKNANGTGAADSHTWKVDTTAPAVTIDEQPKDPSPGGNSSFRFHASEAVSGFECSLSAGAAPASFSTCTSPRDYSGLADGSYTFRVRATDPVGNQSTPGIFPLGAYTWTIDNSLADTTPPETTIDSRPPDPSTSSTASFTYSSSEPGSSFRCSLDGAAFASCPTTGVTYSGLSNGSHSFQVQAVDPSSNADPSPAGYSFEVVLAVTAPSLPIASSYSPQQPPPNAPDTTISGKPNSRTTDRTPTFRFRASAAGSTFQCKLDGKPFKPCSSPLTTKTLSYARHTFQVRAAASGAIDPSPAKFSFRIVRR